MYEIEHINKYNKAASHGSCIAIKPKHIYGVEYVIMISQF